jgi:hypothetical protein
MRIYVLLLKGGKYYVGKSSQVTERILAHFRNSGSEWTKLYPPVKIVEIIPMNHPRGEDMITLKYMAVKGQDNVRGGSYCQLKLPDLLDHSVNTTRENRGADNSCFHCGSRDHWVASCPNKNKNYDLYTTCTIL